MNTFVEWLCQRDPEYANEFIESVMGVGKAITKDVSRYDDLTGLIGKFLRFTRPWALAGGVAAQSMGGLPSVPHAHDPADRPAQSMSEPLQRPKPKISPFRYGIAGVANKLGTPGDYLSQIIDDAEDQVPDEKDRNMRSAIYNSKLMANLPAAPKAPLDYTQLPTKRGRGA